MTTRAFALAAAAALLAAQGAGAQPDRAAAQRACKSDYYRYCADVERGGGRVAACLRANKDKLSKACRAHVEQAEKARRESSSPS